MISFADFNTLEWFRYAEMNEIMNLAVFQEAFHEYPVAFSFIAAWFGCNIGSFLNVCIYRIPLGMSLISPPSHCPNCNHKITFWENIPIFSYLFLGRKCSACKKPISPDYMIGELITGVVFGILFYMVVKSGMSMMVFLLYAILVSVLIPSSVIDFYFRIIPNQLTYSLLILAPLYHLLHGVIKPPHLLDFQAFFYSLLSAVIIWAVLWALSYLGKLAWKKEALGLGDVKLLAGIAASLGIFPILFIILFSCIIAITWIPIYRVINPRRARRAFPFGPFIALGTAVWLLIGIQLSNRIYQNSNDVAGLERVELVHPRNYHYEEMRHNILGNKKSMRRKTLTGKANAGL